MSIFNFLRKKKKEEIKEEKKEEVKAVKEKKEERVGVKPAKLKKPAEKKIVAKKRKSVIKTGISYKILKIPHISEKATDLVEKNQYIFNVAQKANKQEIRQAVEDVYGVDVVRVNVINIPRRKRRVGKTMGWKQGYRKAIVKVKEGQKIELLPR
ncbi:50S ribosomal protein L23 [Candidatus Parcubacteria bacterium]|nr:50S ribosomal protein L23 [Candidatus Parcubacteria bacterium]